jgi:hypothetical protein
VSGWVQQDLFGGELAMSNVDPDPTLNPVLRVPGWYLVTGQGAPPRWWHLLSSSGLGGTVVTRCGLRGHVVSEAQRLITQCPECLS